jgi:hypothetical protein
MLAVSCDRCDRAGKYRLDTLIVRHGAGFGIPGVLALLSADCPKRQSRNFYDMCGIRCPDLSALFLAQPRQQP